MFKFNNIYLYADLLHTGQEINLLPWISTIIEVEEQQLQLMANQGNIYSILLQNIYCTVLECTVNFVYSVGMDACSASEHRDGAMFVFLHLSNTNTFLNLS
jgi:hypothetical protein